MKLAMVLMLVVLASVLAVQSTLAQSSLPSSLGWYQVPNTMMGAVCQNGVNTCAPVVTAWNSGVFDTLRNRLIIWGGGHGDYSGNEIYALNLNGTPNFERITNSTAGGCSQESCDGGLTPNSRHTYDGIEYMPNVDRMFVFGGSRAGNGYPLNGTWTFNFANKTWQLMNPAGQNPGAVLGVTTAYDPNTGLIFIEDQNSLYSYDFSTNSYTRRGGAYNPNFHHSGAIDPKRKLYVLVGGNVNETSIFDISGNGSYDRQQIVTTGPAPAGDYPGLVYDPVTDRMVVWIGGDTVYSLNLDTRTWTTTTYTGGPGASQAIGVFGRWNYSPALKVFVLVNSVTQNAFTFRLSPGVPDTQAPTAPTNLAASASSSSQMNLSWTASTDNVGVAGYQVERCQGVSCTNFAQIGTAASATYVDTNLGSSTPYQYRVRAMDGSGNLSSYSSIASATTQPPDTNAPSMPTSLSATVQSAYQINLSWTVSTDNVGVTGYRLERCQGSGCSSFVQIASPLTNSYADSAVLGSTSYSYRVRAIDAAGNLSSYSSIGNATTPVAPPGFNAEYWNSGTGPSPVIPATAANLVRTDQFIDFTWDSGSPAAGINADHFIARWTKTETLAAGNYQFSVTADDGVRVYLDNSLVIDQWHDSQPTTYTATASIAAGAHNIKVEYYENAYAAFIHFSYALTSSTPSGTTLPVGALVHDGPPTPEQISLFLPVTGSLPQTATASVRYKPTSSSSWTTGHPLFRIQPGFANSPAVGSVPDAFAWPIIDLVPGTSYDVEVTVTSGSTTDIRTGTFTTRALPVPAGTATKTISAGSSTATIQAAFDGLNAGDVIQFQNGTYTVDGLQLRRSGTLNSPIIIRGASRTGVVLSDPTGSVLQIQAASHVIIENLTLQGSNVDSGTNASSKGIEFYSGSPTQTRITIRNVMIQGVDIGIKAYHEISEFLAYDNTLTGNNSWISAMIDSNQTWNDDGINMPGFGNCAFNNSLKGFGDSMAYETQQLTTQSIGVHFYRNEIRNSGDDMAEGDGSIRNNTLYDNRSHNSMTFLSLDPVFGGPFVAARNVVINTGRSPFKFNNQNSGQFVYNNTIIRTNGSGSGVGWGWVQFNNGPQQAWGYQNNILIYQGSGGLMANEAGGNSPVDFTHNSWFPNAGVWWTNTGGTFSTLAAAYSGLPATTPVFSGATKRHEQDNITVASPWTTAIMLGASHLAEVTQTFTPMLASGTTPKNSGTVIPNITDGFSGVAPDRGATIAGRSIPVYGDRTSSVSDTQAPTAPTNLAAIANSSLQIDLSWTASTDNIGVAGYQVERCQGASCTNFAPIGTASGATYSDAGLAASSTYLYRIRAIDIAGNLSSYSASASATTQPPDTNPPSMPTNLSATVQSAYQINLSWTVSTDNVGVTGYRLERCQGLGCSSFVEIGSPSAGSYADNPVLASSSYSYRVRAIDAAGNLSSYSSIASATTPAAPPSFNAEYWNSGTGASPSIPATPANLTRNDLSIDFTWNSGSPDPAINADHFIARWTKTETFAGGDYQFSVSADDGVRVYLDNSLIIDQWHDAQSTTYTATATIAAGPHNIKVEYYENAYAAFIKFNYGLASSSTATLQVGPGKPYATIAAAVAASPAGSTIEIDAGIYANESMTISQNNLTLRGIGGYAHLKWGTGDYLTNTSTISNGKAILIIGGNDITLENLEFSGAKVVNENGAGIRYEGGNLTIRGSYFHNNENGILGQGGLSNTLLIENSIFAQNGYCLSACAHNVYIGSMGKLIFRFNKSIDSREGHTLKSRAQVNEITSNFFSTKNSDGSYEAEFPNGGTVYFVGNIVEQGANSGNSTMLGYGFEGVTNPNPAVYIINNTFYNWRTSGATFVQVNGSPALSIKSNIFAGGGTSLVGGSTDLTSNLILSASTFANVDSGNFRLVAGSPAIDAGVAAGTAGSYDLTPQWQYVEPAGKETRGVVGSALDVGAYEFGTSSPSDTTPPAASITAPVSGTTVSGSLVTVAATAADNSGVVGVLFKLDGANLGVEDTIPPYSIVWNTVLTTNGSHILAAVARDAAGNQTIAPNVTVTVYNADTTAPTTSIIAPSAGTTVYGSSVMLSATATDNVGVAGVQFLLDGAAVGAEDTVTPFSIMWSTTAVPNGSHTLKAVARDAAGNKTTSAGVTVTINNDSTAPVVAITAPVAGSTLAGSNITISASASDNVGIAGVQFKIDGLSVGTEVSTTPYVFFWNTTQATDGAHTISAVARDAAGNQVASTPITVNVDNGIDLVVPLVSITEPQPDKLLSAFVTLSASASDNIGVVGVQFLVDGVNVGAEDTTAPYSLVWDTTKIPNGSHKVKAIARDGAGNRSNPAEINVSVSNTSGGGRYNIKRRGGGSWKVQTGSPITSPESATLASDPLNIGYLRIQTDSGNTAPTGAAIFGFSNNGVVVSEAGVPTTVPTTSGLLPAEIAGAVNTGIAFANPNNQESLITFTFYNASGASVWSGSFSLGANRQMSAMLDQEPFGGPNGFLGTFAFTASTPVSAIALRGLTNERAEFLMTTLPITSLQNGAAGLMVLPFFADGGGWSTQVILENPGALTLNGTVQFFGPGSSSTPGTLLNMTVNGSSGSTFSYSIPPFSSARFVTAGSTPGIQVGSVRINPTDAAPAPQGLGIFSYRTLGITVSEASVPLSVPGTGLQTFIEYSVSDGIRTGLSISNPLPSPTTANLELTTLDGAATGLFGSVLVPGNGQMSQFLDEIFPSLPAGFQGVLRVTAPSPISVIGLRGRLNLRGDFLITTIPVANDAFVVPPPFETIFPHVVMGGGYTTEFVLFSSGPEGSASGTMQLLGKDGAPLPFQLPQ